MNAFDFENLASDKTKNFRLEAFSFTFQYGLNIYFDDLDDLKNIIGESEIEFWQVEGMNEYTYMDVKTFQDLETAIELIEDGHFQEDLDNFSAILKEGYAPTLADAKQWHEDNHASESMNEYDFGYYLMHEVQCVEIPEALQGYIDYEQFGKDALINDYVVIGSNIYHNC
jgi:hypothetical protein